MRFECTLCGNCCRNHGDYAFVYLAAREVPAIAAYLGLSPETFRKRHCDVDGGWTVLRLGDEECRFLGPDGRCGIYPVRPAQCAAWPFWEANLRRETWENDVVPTCPGIGRGPLYTAAEIEGIARETEAGYEEEDPLE